MKEFVLSDMPALTRSEGEWWDFSPMMVQNWQQFASFAWDGYLKAARGFVRLNEDRAFGYVAASAPALVASREPEDRLTREKCARYQPEHEFVITGNFARDEQAMNSGEVELLIGVMRPWLQGMLAPPDAYHESVRAIAHEVALLRTEQRRHGH
jgi:hypothetical protein